MSLDNLLKVAEAAASLGNIAGDVFEDHKLNMADLASLPAAFPLLKNLAAVDFSKVLPEMKAGSSADYAEFVALFKEKFDIPQDALESEIESILDEVTVFYNAIQAAIRISNRLKKKA